LNRTLLETFVHLATLTTTTMMCEKFSTFESTAEEEEEEVGHGLRRDLGAPEREGDMAHLECSPTLSSADGGRNIRPADVFYG
jgi:hypothetical protein